MRRSPHFLFIQHHNYAVSATVPRTLPNSILEACTHCCIAVDVIIWTVWTKEETDKSRNQGEAEADGAVDPKIFTKGGRVGACEEDEVNVDGHGERPPWIGLHEPAEKKCQRRMVKSIENRNRLTFRARMLEPDTKRKSRPYGVPRSQWRTRRWRRRWRLKRRR